MENEEALYIPPLVRSLCQEGLCTSLYPWFFSGPFGSEILWMVPHIPMGIRMMKMMSVIP